MRHIFENDIPILSPHKLPYLNKYNQVQPNSTNSEQIVLSTLTNFYFLIINSINFFTACFFISPQKYKFFVFSLNSSIVTIKIARDTNSSKVLYPSVYYYLIVLHIRASILCEMLSNANNLHCNT